MSSNSGGANEFTEFFNNIISVYKLHGKEKCLKQLAQEMANKVDELTSAGTYNDKKTNLEAAYAAAVKTANALE